MSGWAIAGQIAADLGGALLGAHGQHKANRMNLQIAREQMAFQERMSNTSYTRAVHDMINAGLNPMLAYSQGGASTPQGSSAVMQNEAPDLRGIGSRAVASAAALQGLKLSEAQARKTNAEAQVLEAEVPWSRQNAQYRSEKLHSEMLNLATSVGTMRLEQKLKESDLESLRPLVLRYQDLLNEAARLGIPEKKATAEFFEKVPQSKWLEVIKQIAPLLMLMKDRS